MTKTKSLTLTKIFKRSLLIAAIPLLLAGLSACSGSDGAPGAKGATGPAGPVTTTNPSCVVCHGDNGEWNVDSTNADSVHFATGQDYDQTLRITNIQLTNVGGDGGATTDGNLQVSFHMENSNGPFTTLTSDGLEIFMSDLIPANTVPIQGTTENYQSRLFRQWASQSISGPLAGFLDLPWAGFDASGSANGNYTITLANGTLDNAAALPYVDLANHVQRVTIMTRNVPTSFSAILPAIAVGVQDFTGVPLTDGNDTSADTTLQYQAAHVTIQACQKCHGYTMQKTAHGDYWADTRICVTCHNPFFETQPTDTQPYRLESAKALFEQWVHEIHNGQVEGNQDFSDVVFPQPVNNCVACHQDPDGLTAGSDANMDAWKTKPNATACTSCHENVNPLDVDVVGIVDGVATTLTAGQNHLAGGQTADSCGNCHTSTGAATATDIVTVHAVTTSAADTPEFEVTMTATEPDGSAPTASYFAAGDTPVITVTLKDASGDAVPGSVYTTSSKDPSAATGVSGGALSTATLYVYGPRNFAAPVLTLHAAADRGEDLRLPSSDPNNLTDSTGYKYKLQAIPANMPAGTYLASVQMADYGTVNGDATKGPLDYKTVSVGLVKFQIGTAVETPKASGDACIGCHGATRMHLDAAHPHNVPFDTDYCNACHDTTGLHGNVIANRVHAVHDANSNGDLGSHASYDWSEINFPQNPQNCVACHNSGATGYKTDFEMVACFGCHSPANDASWDHMLQMGGVNTDQNPNFKQSTR